MKAKVKKVGQGFTIVEVLIVLAIAALILAVVFYAVPQLQRSQRDNQRQSMDTRIKTELDAYAGNNQGTYPFAGVGSAWTNCSTSNATPQSCYQWYNNYLSGGKVNITDPSVGTTTICYSNSSTAINGATKGTTGTCSGNWTEGMVWIGVGDKCSGDNLVKGTGGAGSASSKEYALIVALERQGTTFCVDNG